MPVGTIAIKENEFVGLDGEWQKFPGFIDPQVNYEYTLNIAKELGHARAEIEELKRQRDLENVKQKRCKQIISKLKAKIKSLTPKMVTLGAGIKLKKLSKSDFTDERFPEQ